MVLYNDERLDRGRILYEDDKVQTLPSKDQSIRLGTVKSQSNPEKFYNVSIENFDQPRVNWQYYCNCRDYAFMKGEPFLCKHLCAFMYAIGAFPMGKSFREIAAMVPKKFRSGKTLRVLPTKFAAFSNQAVIDEAFRNKHEYQTELIYRLEAGQISKLNELYRLYERLEVITRHEIFNKILGIVKDKLEAALLRAPLNDVHKLLKKKVIPSRILSVEEARDFIARILANRRDYEVLKKEFKKDKDFSKKYSEHLLVLNNRVRAFSK
ncbi:MAG: hypothetical protein ABIG20_00050 [archaeon]